MDKYGQILRQTNGHKDAEKKNNDKKTNKSTDRKPNRQKNKNKYNKTIIQEAVQNYFVHIYRFRQTGL